MKNLLLFLIMILAGCANETVSTEFRLVEESNEVATLIQGATVRFWYTYSGIGIGTNGQQILRVSPENATPLTVSNSFNWATSKEPGYDIVGVGDASGEIEFPNLPIGKNGTEIAAEFLQPDAGTGQLYVVAYWCLRPTGTLTEGTLKSLSADSRSATPGTPEAYLIKKGRTCGKCSSPQEGNATPSTPCP